jgi:hypothetical protein
LTDLCFFAQNGFDGEVFVMKVEDRFEYVRESPVTYIVQQRCDAYRHLVVFGDRVAVPQLGEDTCCKVERTEAMREARMFGGLVRKVSEAELANTSKTLELR